MLNLPNLPKGGSTVHRSDKLLFRLESWLNLSGGIIIFLLVLLTVSNALGRWIFNLPITGYIDWIEQSMAFFAFLGISYCQRNGEHIRVNIIIGLLRGHLLCITELLTIFLTFCITLVLIYGSYLHAWRAYSIGDSSIDIELSTWPAKLVVPVALTILALRLAVQIWACFLILFNNSEPPVAHTIIEDIEAQAVHETQALNDKTKD